MPNTTDAPGDSKAKPSPKLDAVGAPEPSVAQPVQPYDDAQPRGARQDGAGTAPPRAERTEATPAGGTRDRRVGSDTAEPLATPTDTGEEHRGKPAVFRSGSAQGSGASAGGTGTGGTEDIDSDAPGGSQREARESAQKG